MPEICVRSVPFFFNSDPSIVPVPGVDRYVPASGPFVSLCDTPFVTLRLLVAPRGPFKPLRAHSPALGEKHKRERSKKQRAAPLS